MNDTVKYLHYRSFPNRLFSGSDVPSDFLGDMSSRAGATVAYYLDKHFNTYVYAIAFCHPRDRFDKKLGRIKSSGKLQSKNHRVLTETNDPKEFVTFMDAFMRAETGYSRRYET